MPPPPTNFTSSIRGFVCKSCRIKLQIPPRAPWLSRNFTAQKPLLRLKDRGEKVPPLASKAEVQQPEQTEEPFYKYYDETPDGVRTEAQPDLEEEELLEGLQEAVREIKDDIGEISAEELEEVDEDEEPSLHMEEWEDAMDAKIERLEAEVNRLESITNKPGPMSEDDRQRIREYFLKSVEEDEAETSTELPPPPTSSTAEQFLKPQPKPDSITIPQSNLRSLLIPEKPYPESARPHIKLLNNVLRKIDNDYGRSDFRMDERLMYNLWKYYVLCRRTLLSCPEPIPAAAWELLWGYVSLQDPTNLDRMAHVKRLGSDMQKAGLHLGGSTLLLYIEAVFVEGDPRTAIELWRAAAQGFFGQQENNNLWDQYLELGTRMFAENGDIDEARKAASIVIQRSSDPISARILIHTIQGCLASTIANRTAKAWDIYLEFRKHMGPLMEMEDYDVITGLFMRAGKHSEALAVFKDMMLTNVPAALKHDSMITRDYNQFPLMLNNKFFFGKWIKKLIGNGDLNEASKVLDLMRNHGVCPDAKFTNGLMGAWFRSGTSKNRKLAEEMGWSMIAARLDFVKAREQGVKGLLLPLRAVEGTNKQEYKHASFNLHPPATIETFSILMEEYVKQQKHEQLLDLYTTLSKAKIPANTNFMNTVLKTDARFSVDTKQIYYTFVTDGVKPDITTFLHLWHNLKQRNMQRHKRHNFFVPRELFAEMMTWANKLKAELGKDGLPRELYNLIIMNFGLVDDQAGTAVALRALQRYFGIYPTDDTARSIILQVTSVGAITGPLVRRLNINKGTKERVRQVTQVLGLLQSQRAEALAKLGINYDDLQGQAKSEEALNLLSDLLRIVTLQVNSGQDGRTDVVKSSKRAAKVMGVPDCVPWVVYNTTDEELLDV
ncbi:4e3dd09c-06ab-4fb2-8753-2f036fae7b6d [Sclerotinia trifoliorum]|uniref:4e3dd09c-06ab-4fb2-8753-2f036fae7b6d n=1 Tax=Sclerotinia trifoliorum TaxID=28548 RepID=A0A8H2ZQV6_9HELO|nr:4e3dd09c-06ab-4fb2-8753-2f036fae7b6d [Sclerotinia trifoliorum]